MPVETNLLENHYEEAIIEHLKGLGYQHLFGPDVPRTSASYRDVFLVDVLEEALIRINRELPKGAIKEALRIISSIDQGSLYARNQTFFEYLVSGVPVNIFVTNEQRTERVWLLDFEHPSSNTFHVVNQWSFVENEPKRPDVILFVNGMPLVVFELKSPSREDVDSSDAYLQIRNYLHAIPSLFVPNVFCVLSDLADTRVGTITANEDRYVQWKTVDGDYSKNKWADYRTMLDGMCSKERLLDIIQNFICFSNTSESTIKILAAYHQYFAVKKAVQSTIKAINSDGKAGVFWHTQGSGKSLSMVFFAHLLQQAVNSPTIVVITDRNDLDNQLFTQFSKCKAFLRQEPVQAKSQKDLVKLLEHRVANGIIFTTMQKFIENETVLSTRKNIIVMADEAHRGQYGILEKLDSKGRIKTGAAGWVRHALPHASFIGFTGTPISTQDKNTREIFGDYIDVYDMTQAVEDGSTRPVYYESRVVALKLDKGTLEELDELYQTAEETINQEALEKSKHTFASLDAVLGSPCTIQSLCKDIVEHYESNRANLLTGKALIVAYSRDIGIKIYKEILRLRPTWQEKVAVVMTASNQDPEEWHSIIGTEQHKKDLANKFKDDDNPLKIAIVVDMWLTGFDVPSLSTMYVFKPMKGHNLMQAIARVNRVYKGKEGGLVVDYIGIASALKQAMSDYTKRDQKKYGEMDIAKTAYPEFQNRLSVCRDIFHNFSYLDALKSKNSKQITDKVLEGADYLLSPDKTENCTNFSNQAKLMDQALSLCKSLATKSEQLEAAYYRAVRSVIVKRLWQNPDKPKKGPSLKELNERISQIVEQSVKTEGVLNLFSEKNTEISLFDESFLQEITAMKQKNLALEMLKRLIEGQVRKYRKTSVVKAQKFSELLQSTVNSYLNGQLSNAEVMQELLNMAKEMMTDRKEANELGLNNEEMAFYDALTQPRAIKDFYENSELIAITKELTETLRKNSTIDWQKKESARANMRRIIKRLLRKYKYPPEDQPEATETIMRQCELWADYSMDV